MAATPMQNIIKNRARPRTVRLPSDGCSRFETAGRIFASFDGPVGDIAVVCVGSVALGFSSRSSASRTRKSAGPPVVLSGRRSSESSDSVALGVEVIGYSRCEAGSFYLIVVALSNRTTYFFTEISFPAMIAPVARIMVPSRGGIRGRPMAGASNNDRTFAPPGISRPMPLLERDASRGADVISWMRSVDLKIRRAQ